LANDIPLGTRVWKCANGVYNKYFWHKVRKEVMRMSSEGLRKSLIRIVVQRTLAGRGTGVNGTNNYF